MKTNKKSIKNINRKLLLALEIGDGGAVQKLIHSGSLTFTDKMYLLRRLRSDERDGYGRLIHHTLNYATLSLDDLVEVAKLNSKDNCAAIATDNQFCWEKVFKSSQTRKKCLQIITSFAENDHGMYVVHAMLLRELITNEDVLRILTKEVKKRRVRLGTEYLLEILAERKVQSAKDICLKALLRVEDSNYIGQDKAALAMMKGLDMPWRECALLYRKLIEPVCYSLDFFHDMLNKLPLRERAEAIALAGSHINIGKVTLPKGNELLLFVKLCKKFCSRGMFEVIRDRVSKLHFQER